MLRDFILIVLGILLSFLDPFIKEFAHTSASKGGWRSAMTGAKNSWSGLLRVMGIALLIAVGLGIYDEIHNRASIEVKSQRHTELINAINGIKLENNQKFLDLIDRIDKVLEQNAEILKRLEAKDVSRNATTAK